MLPLAARLPACCEPAERVRSKRRSTVKLAFAHYPDADLVLIDRTSRHLLRYDWTIICLISCSPSRECIARGSTSPAPAGGRQFGRH
jgi:hypothetical protein